MPTKALSKLTAYSVKGFTPSYEIVPLISNDTITENPLERRNGWKQWLSANGGGYTLSPSYLVDDLPQYTTINIDTGDLPNFRVYNYLQVTIQPETSIESTSYWWITSIEWVSPTTVTLVLEKDVWNTYIPHAAIQGRKMLVTRNLVYNDFGYNNFEREAFLPTQYHVQDYLLKDTRADSVVILAANNGNSAGLWDGVFCGLSVARFDKDDLSRIKAYIQSHTDIVAVYAAHSEMLLTGALYPSPTAIVKTLDFAKYKNAKLYKYPYSFFTLTLAADRKEGRFENYEKFQTMIASMPTSTNPQCTLNQAWLDFEWIATGINSPTFSFDLTSPGDAERLHLVQANYPQLPWGEDAYTRWLAANSNVQSVLARYDMESERQRAALLAATSSSISSSTGTSSVFSTNVSGSASFSVGAGLGETTNMINQKTGESSNHHLGIGFGAGGSISKSESDVSSSQISSGFSSSAFNLSMLASEKEAAMHSALLADAKNAPDIGHGTLSATLDSIDIHNCFWLHVYTPQNPELLDNFFSLYGYATQRPMPIYLHKRSYYDYIATSNFECDFDGLQPSATERATIAQIFNRGVTIWHTLEPIPIDRTQLNNCRNDNVPAWVKTGLIN